MVEIKIARNGRRRAVQARQFTRQLGISMVEILVSLVIGLMLMIAVSGVYISGRQTAQFGSEFAQIQEGARAVLDDMARDIRMSGFLGCFSAHALNRASPGLVPVVRRATPLSGGGLYPLTEKYLSADESLKGGSAEALTLPVPNLTPVAGTDYVQSQFGTPVAFVAEEMETVTSPVKLSRPVKLHLGEPFVLSGCRKALVVRATNGTVEGFDRDTLEHVTGAMNRGAPVVADGTVGDSVGQGALVSTISSVVYFLATDNDNGTVNLYRWDGIGTPKPELFMPNVEDLKVMYGVDPASSGDVSAWKTASEVTTGNEWGKVLLVSVNILARSEKQVAGQIPDTYAWNAAARSFQKSGAAADQYFRKPYTVSVTLRARTSY